MGADVEAHANATAAVLRRRGGVQEVRELQASDADDFLAEAVEDNIFEWHFVMRGPRDTEFEGGVYHGRIILPNDYPMKPPSFMLLTPNGRFEVNTKICLSISEHHPEHWQPSWSVRTALTALVAFMPTPADGAIGSLDYTQDERRALAAKSREAAPTFGNAARRELAAAAHAKMLRLSSLPSPSRSAPGPAGEAGPGPCAAGPGARRSGAAGRPGWTAAAPPVPPSAAASGPAPPFQTGRPPPGPGAPPAASASVSRLRRRPSRQPGRCTCNGPPHHGIGEMEGMVGSNSPAGACAGPHGPAWMDAPPGRALPRMSFHDTQKLVKNWFNSSLRPTPPPRDFFFAPGARW